MRRKRQQRRQRAEQHLSQPSLHAQRQTRVRALTISPKLAPDLSIRVDRRADSWGSEASDFSEEVEDGAGDGERCFRESSSESMRSLSCISASCFRSCSTSDRSSSSCDACCACWLSASNRAFSCSSSATRLMKQKVSHCHSVAQQKQYRRRSKRCLTSLHRSSSLRQIHNSDVKACASEGVDSTSA